MHHEIARATLAIRSRHWWNRFARAMMVLLVGMLPVMGASAADPELPPLAANPGTPRLPGKFIWADLATNDVEAARNFYGTLLGWQFHAFGDGDSRYTIALNDGRALSGIVRARARPGTASSPRWVGYISVPDVVQTGRAIVGLGGRQLVAPKRLPQRGEQAVFADPEGVVFGVMTSAAGDPEDFLAEPGDWIWMTLLTRDAAKAAAFYRAVAGYVVIENTDSALRNDFMLVSGAFSRAAVTQVPADRPNVVPAWLPFVRVRGLSGALSQVPKLGGKILVAPRSDLFSGRLAVVADPTGAPTGLLQWERGPGEGRKRP